MKIHILQTTPPPVLQASLIEFERQFAYPLGPHQQFRISHGEDYTRFFRAMGTTTCLVAEMEERIVGTLALVARQILTPAGQPCDATYLADLKIAPSARGGFVLRDLARSALAIGQTKSGFSVVMRGTRALPATYTGRMGIPRFIHVGEVSVLRIPTGDFDNNGAVPAFAITESNLRDLFVSLSRTAYATPRLPGAPRGQYSAIHLALPNGEACGVLEDTLVSKRLFIVHGEEMRSAHLSNFGFQTADAGTHLIKAALHHSRQRDLPALFVSVPIRHCDDLLRALGIPGVTVAPADIYGVGLEPATDWNINTAEI